LTYSVFPFFYSFAFEFNPALQPRSIVVLGCIYKEADDRLVQKVLNVLIMVRGSFRVLIQNVQN